MAPGAGCSPALFFWAGTACFTWHWPHLSRRGSGTRGKYRPWSCFPSRGRWRQFQVSP